MTGQTLTYRYDGITVDLDGPNARNGVFYSGQLSYVASEDDGPSHYGVIETTFPMTPATVARMITDNIELVRTGDDFLTDGRAIQPR